MSKVGKWETGKVVNISNNLKALSPALKGTRSNVKFYSE